MQALRRGAQCMSAPLRHGRHTLRSLHSISMQVLDLQMVLSRYSSTAVGSRFSSAPVTTNRFLPAAYGCGRVPVHRVRGAGSGIGMRPAWRQAGPVVVRWKRRTIRTRLEVALGLGHGAQGAGWPLLLAEAVAGM